MSFDLEKSRIIRLCSYLENDGPVTITLDSRAKQSQANDVDQWTIDLLLFNHSPMSQFWIREAEIKKRRTKRERERDTKSFRIIVHSFSFILLEKTSTMHQSLALTLVLLLIISDHFHAYPTDKMINSVHAVDSVGTRFKRGLVATFQHHDMAKNSNDDLPITIDENLLVPYLYSIIQRNNRKRLIDFWKKHFHFVIVIDEHLNKSAHLRIISSRMNLCFFSLSFRDGTSGWLLTTKKRANDEDHYQTSCLFNSHWQIVKKNSLLLTIRRMDKWPFVAAWWDFFS